MKKLPNHVAIIMDGNSRWAQKKDLSKEKGHKEGVKKARLAVEFFLQNGIKDLTLFAFSTENWGREKKEVKALMKLFLEAISEQTPDLIKNKVKLNFIGEISRFDKILIKQIKKSQESTNKYDSKMNLDIAISLTADEKILEKRLIERSLKDNRSDDMPAIIKIMIKKFFLFNTIYFSTLVFFFPRKLKFLLSHPSPSY